MKIFNEKINELGTKYQNDFNAICVDTNYNNSKIFSEDANSNINKYIQTTSEEMIFYLLKKKIGNAICDYTYNNPKDVDVYSKDDHFEYFIEIKTPELVTKFDEQTTSKIHGELNNRYPDNILSHDEYNKEMIEIVNLFEGKADIKPVRDNKVKDYLLSTQEKMIDSTDKTINCLLICSSSEMTHLINYFVNEYSGFHTKSFMITPEEYNKIDFIVFSNVVEAHLDSHFKFNVWDCSNYVYFILPNYHKKICEDKLIAIQKIFNDCAKDYFSNRDSYIYCDGDKLDDTFGLHNYLAKKFPYFIPDKSARKY